MQHLRLSESNWTTVSLVFNGNKNSIYYLPDNVIAGQFEAMHGITAKGHLKINRDGLFIDPVSWWTCTIGMD